MAEEHGGERTLLTMREAAARLAISRSKAYELARDGKLPGVIRVGSSMRVSRAKLDAWVERVAAEGAA